MTFRALHNSGCPTSTTRAPVVLSSVPLPVLFSSRQAAPCRQHSINSAQLSSAPSARFSSIRWPPVSRGAVLCHGTPGLINLPIDKDLEQPLSGFDSIRSALDDLAAGKFIVVIDDEDRENEGDLIIAADKVTTESMHFMVENTSGVICISMDGHDLDRLRLPLMVNSAENEEAMYTAFTVTVDLKDGITTGISASDRAKTIRRLADPKATATDFRRPGHIFPLRYHPGGVLVRPGHTEAGVDLARLAGCYPAGVLCEIVNRTDGSMARTPQLLEFAKQHKLKCITIADLIRYRLKHDRLVLRTASATVQSSAYGQLTLHTYRCALDESEHVAVVVGGSGAQGRGPVPVHVRRDSCVTDLLVDNPGALLNGGAVSGGLHTVLSDMAAQGQGVVVYMRPRFDGRPSLAAEVRALSNADSTEAAARRTSRTSLGLRVYGLSSQILRDLGVTNAVTVGEGCEQTAIALSSCGLAAQHQPPAQHVNGNGAAAANLAGVR